MQKKYNCPICDYPFEKAQFAIAKTRNFYAWLLQKDQRCPGRMVIQTHEHIEDLTEWTDELWQEFGRFNTALQQAVHKAFDHQEQRKLINLECKMNGAYRKGHDPHTHWHLIPRYRNPIFLTDPDTKEQVQFCDEQFGESYGNKQCELPVSKPMAFEIIKQIQEQLDLSKILDTELKKVSI